MSCNLTTSELTSLMSSRSQEDIVRKYGSVEQFLKELGTDPIAGLSEPVVILHRKAYGSNVMALKKPPSYWCTLLLSLKDPVSIVLIIVSILLITFGLMPEYTYDKYAWIDGLITLFMLLLILLISAFVVSRKEHVLWRSIGIANRCDTTVIHDSKETSKQADTIVVGDIIRLKVGSIVPADGMLIASSKVSVVPDITAVTNQTLTNSSPSIVSDSFLSAGSYVMSADGDVRMVVLAVGANTTLGRTRLEQSYISQSTEMQKRLEKIYLWTTVEALIGSILIFIAMTVRFFTIVDPNDNRLLTVLVQLLSIVLIVFIVAAPEALQMSLSLSLSYRIKSMLKNGIRLRSYGTIENLACCSHLIVPTNMLPKSADELAIVTDAGVKVYYATPDARDTAQANARKAGLLGADQVDGSISATELFALQQNEICRRVRQVRVIFDMTPANMHHLVCSLKEANSTVACVSSNTDEAAALRVADVGITVEDEATDLCCDCSDIALKCAGFSDLIRAIQWGYGIVDNVRKFIQFQYTAGNCVIILVLLASAVFNQLLLSAVQLLYINLFIDVLAAFAFGGEPLSGARGGRQIKRLLQKNYFVFNPSMVRNIYVAIFYICIIGTLSSYPAFADKLFGIPDKLTGPRVSEDVLAQALAVKFRSTCVYNFFFLALLFSMFWARATYTELNIFANIKTSTNFLIVWCVAFCVHLLVMLVPGITDIFKTFSCTGSRCLLGGANGVIPPPLKFFSIGWQGWLVTTLLAALILPLNIAFRFLPILTEFRRKEPQSAQIAL